MLRSVQDWLRQIPLSDPFQRDQAIMFQIFLFVIIGASFLGMLSSLLAALLVDRIVGVVSTLMLIVIMVGALAILRRGHLFATVLIVVISLNMIALSNMVPTGIEGSRAVFILFAVPIVLAGLVGNSQILAFSFLLSAFCVSSIAWFEITTPTLVGYVPDVHDGRFTTLIFIIGSGIVAVLVNHFGHIFRIAFKNALQREHDLDHMRASLEVTVSERTVELQQALATVEQREAKLAQTLASLHASEAVVRDLSSPLIPVLPGVLVAPLIGRLDDIRIAAMIDHVLATIERMQAHDLIFDVTGVSLVDTQVAQAVINTAEAARLLGARTTIVGIRPEVAQTIISLGIQVSQIATYPTLQEAIISLMQRSSLRVLPT